MRCKVHKQQYGPFAAQASIWPQQRIQFTLPKRDPDHKSEVLSDPCGSSLCWHGRASKPIKLKETGHVTDCTVPIMRMGHNKLIKFAQR